MTAIALTVTDSAGGNARHAVGVHVVLVNDDGKILLGRRARTLRLAGGLWATPCGNLEAGEPAPHGAARELFEEHGIIIDPVHLDFATATHFMNNQGFGSALAFFFTARAWSGTPRICEPDKCDEIGWFDFDALPQPIVPYVANALADVRAGLAAGRLEAGFSTFGWPEAAPAAS